MLRKINEAETLFPPAFSIAASCLIPTTNIYAVLLNSKSDKTMPLPYFKIGDRNGWEPRQREEHGNAVSLPD
ncbi:hypothetical protein QUB05_06175 [Microcoleus sp. F10-C6]|uniref:hypothetical protein n=1 Tax=unclassified Microcoleus TaxID=2642155 RepID=UPI002FCF677B